MEKKKKKKRNAYYDNDGLKMEQKLNSKDKRLKKKITGKGATFNTQTKSRNKWRRE